MTQTIRVVYRDGVFVPLEQVDWAEETEGIVQQDEEVTREDFLARMRADGVIEDIDPAEISKYSSELTQEEIFEIGRKLSGGKTVLDLVNEQREERF